MENKIWYLRRSHLFERASDETIARCEHLFTQKVFAKRTRIFEQGDPAQMVYLLKRGKVRIGRLTEDGKEVMLALLGPGDLFGEEVVFEAPARTTIATCIEESLLCMARAPDLYGLLARHPILAVNIAKYLKEQRDDALSTVEDVAYLKVPDRLMKLLERLAAEYGAPTPQGTRIDVRLTQADLASLIGSTRETVSLELSQFERAGRIRMDGRAIVLCDAPRGALTAASA